MLERYIPAIGWMRRYKREDLPGDLIASVIVTIMLIPQSFAYALLANLPPQVGLYASVLPLVGYALFGSSRTLAVGPVAVVSLMTATAISGIAQPGTQEHWMAAIVLALMSGLLLMAMGFVRLGFIANFLSHPVISGFITGSAILIAASQLKHILGVRAEGVKIVGDIPAGLPPATMPSFDPALWAELFPAALAITVVGLVESISVAQSLAAKRRQKIDPDQELRGLGAANIAAAFSGGYPVTGGFARSVVNFAAGANTQLASILTAALIAMTALFFAPAFYYLPNAILAATIIVAVLGLVDIKTARRVWSYNKADGIALAATAIAVLAIGVEAAIAIGVALSIGLYLLRTSRPHIAVVGQVPGTEHYRNIERHQVITSPKLLAVRVDESLYFANARNLEDRLLASVAERPEVRDVVLILSAVNFIDASALESLEHLIERLKDAGVTLHLAEVKGPVMDRLEPSGILDHLTGRVFLSTHQAVEALTPAGVGAAAARPWRRHLPEPARP